MCISLRVFVRQMCVKHFDWIQAYIQYFSGILQRQNIWSSKVDNTIPEYLILYYLWADSACQAVMGNDLVFYWHQVDGKQIRHLANTCAVYTHIQTIVKKNKQKNQTEYNTHTDPEKNMISSENAVLLGPKPKPGVKHSICQINSIHTNRYVTLHYTKSIQSLCVNNCLLTAGAFIYTNIFMPRRCTEWKTIKHTAT